MMPSANHMCHFFILMHDKGFTSTKRALKTRRIQNGGIQNGATAAVFVRGEA